MAGQDVEAGTARAAGIVGILILICGIADSVCGFIWVGYGIPGGHGLWSGIGVKLPTLLKISHAKMSCFGSHTDSLGPVCGTWSAFDRFFPF